MASRWEGCQARGDLCLLCSQLHTTKRAFLERKPDSTLQVRQALYILRRCSRPLSGDTLDIYGFSNTSYQVIIDPSFPEPYTANITTNAALASSADSQSRAALFSTTSLSSNAQLLYAPHEVLIRNLGAGVLGLDYMVVGGIPVGAEG